MKEYFVKRIKSNLLSISGEQMHPVWEMADVITDFSYPWENAKAPQIIFRALFDEENFYFRFDVQEENVLTFVDQNHKMEVVDSDRVEIFFRQDEKLNPYYCLEMDSKARILDYACRYYRDFDYKWQWPMGAIDVKASSSLNAYVVEGAIQLSSLLDLGLLKNNILEAGLYRGQSVELVNNKKGTELRWISWVKPNSKEADFHIPSSFGKMILEKN